MTLPHLPARVSASLRRALYVLYFIVFVPVLLIGTVVACAILLFPRYIFFDKKLGDTWDYVNENRIVNTLGDRWPSMILKNKT